LCHVAFLYFSIVDVYADILTKDQKISIVYGHIYLFTNHISFEFLKYRLFK